MTSKLDTFPSNSHLLIAVIAAAWSASPLLVTSTVGWATLLALYLWLAVKWLRGSKEAEPKP